MYKVTVDQENLPPGGEVYIHGLGTFKNGETAEVSDQQALQFSLLNSIVDHATDDQGRMTLKPQAGPTLEEAAAGMYGVTVEKDGTQYSQQIAAQKTEATPPPANEDDPPLDPALQAQMEADMAEEQNKGGESK